MSGDAEAFREIYRFAGCGFEERYLDDVFSSSIGKQDVPEVASEIADACEAMQRELDACYEKLRDGRRGSSQSS